MADTDTPTEIPAPARLAPLVLHAERCTAYLRGGFGFKRYELREIDVRVGPYAQHVAAVQLWWIEKGKRTRMGANLSDADGVGLVILAGHGHPEVADPMTQVRIEGGVGTSMTRWTCYAPEWSEEFARQFDAYFATKVVLGDYRSHDVSGGARFRELQKGAPLTAGDRVMTHQGPGLIVMVRRAANGRDAEAFRVRMDHPIENAVTPGKEERLWWVVAEKCRWEGAENAREVLQP